MDEVRRDAELQPPGRQLGDTASATRAERRAIVAADRSGQPILAKSPFKTRPNALDRGIDNPQLDQKTAVTVGHRQWINPPLIPGAEPALEVGTPLIVGAPDRRAGPPLVERAAAPLHRRDQASTLENAPDRRSRRPCGIRRLALDTARILRGPRYGNRRRAAITFSAIAPSVVCQHCSGACERSMNHAESPLSFRFRHS